MTMKKKRLIATLFVFGLIIVAIVASRLLWLRTYNDVVVRNASRESLALVRIEAQGETIELRDLPHLGEATVRLPIARANFEITAWHSDGKKSYQFFGVPERSFGVRWIVVILPSDLQPAIVGAGSPRRNP